MSLFTLKGKLTSSQNLVLGLVGLLLFILIWWLMAELFSEQRPILQNYQTHLPSSLDKSPAAQALRDSILQADSLAFANATEFEKIYPLLPTPLMVVKSVPELYQKDELTYNTFLSIWRNVQGYFWALIISIPIGFIIGLIPLAKGLFSRQIDAMRYLPLTALLGLFILWFGIEEQMKVAFLAFGIIVYLLPVVMQRINEVEGVYLKTVFTLGATDWQTIKTVYLPSVMSKLIDDIRVLTAISWTYIIIAEYVNRAGGIGALIWQKQRLGQKDKLFAILLIIILVGFIQDLIFVYLDRRLFPHKYYKTVTAGLTEAQYGIYATLIFVALGLILMAMFSSLTSTMHLVMIIATIAGLVMIAYGEFKFFKTSKQNA